MLIERSGGPRPVVALLNLRGLSGQLEVPRPIVGMDLISGARLKLAGRVAIPREPLILE